MELPAQAIEKNRELHQLVLARGLTPTYLTRKCKEAVPEWRLCPLPEKKAFTPQEKRERKSYARKAVLYPMERWQSTVFLDEHMCFRRLIALPAIHLAGRRLKKRRTVKDKRKKLYPWGYPKLHFMYGVHWKLGVLGPYWISDTTGYEPKRSTPYEVSLPCHPATHPPSTSPAESRCHRSTAPGMAVDRSQCREQR